MLDIPCVAHPRDAAIGPDDAVILCMKGQHTEAALRDLYAAVGDQARVVCCQNGVENERLALRRFPHTYGMVVMLPAEHLEPGVVVNFAEGTAGGLDTGCYPTGVDAFVEELTTALVDAGFSSAPDPAIMGQKYAKLLANLNNAVQAATGTGSRAVGAKLRRRHLPAIAPRASTVPTPRIRVPVVRTFAAVTCRVTGVTAARRYRACCAERATSRPTS